MGRKTFTDKQDNRPVNNHEGRRKKLIERLSLDKVVPLIGLMVKVSALRAAGLGSVPALSLAICVGRVKPVT